MLAYREHQEQELLLSRQLLSDEIEAFESSINHTVHRDTGIDIRMFREVGGQPGSGIPELVYLDSKYLEDELASSKILIRHQHEHANERQRSNESRRGKLIREFESNDCLEANAHADEQVLKELSRLSAVEIREEEMMKDIQRRKKVFMINAANRRRKIEDFSALVESRQREDEAELRSIELEEVVPLHYESQMHRLHSYHQATAWATRQSVVEEVGGIIDRVLDVTVWIISNNEFGGYRATDDDFPRSIWREAVTLFASDTQQIHSLPFPAIRKMPNDYSRHFSYIDAEVLSTVIEQSSINAVASDHSQLDQSVNFDIIAAGKAKSYVQDLSLGLNSGEALVELKEDYLQMLSKTLPENSESMIFIHPPETLFKVPLKHLFGEIIVDVRNRASTPQVPLEPQVKCLMPCLRVLILGTSLIARQETAAYLNRELGLTIISLNLIVSDLIKGDYSEGEALRTQVLESLGSGKPVSGSVAVWLLLHEINRLQDLEGFVGYVIVDFPNSQDEMVLLLRSLSGLDFGTFEPHPSDLASPFAPPMPFTRQHHAASASGIDAVISIDTPVRQVVLDDVRSRVDMRASRVTYLDTTVDSVNDTIENVLGNQSKYTIGVESERRREMLVPLESLLQDVGLMTRLSSDDEGRVDKESLHDIALHLHVLMESMSVTKLSEVSVESSVAEESLTMSDSVDEDEQTLPLGATESKASVTTVLTTDAGSMVSPPVHSGVPAMVPVRLAKVLSKLWDEIERQSTQSISRFYRAIHEVRLLTFSRRRLSNDVLHSYQARNDNKHNLIGKFGNEYNSIENDFRYDNDCKAEMCLRILELRDQMFQMAKSRRLEAEDMMSKIQNDGMTAIYIHRLHCEGVAFLQTELNRFIVTLHLIFDYLKSFVGRPLYEKYENDLEETIKSAYDPVDDEFKSRGKAKDHKSKETKKGKKGEAQVPVPYREAVPKLILSKRILELPTSSNDEDKRSKSSSKVIICTLFQNSNEICCCSLKRLRRKKLL